MLVTGVVLALVGAVLLTYAAVQMSRANRAAFPLWTNPPVRPRGARVYRAIGAGLAVLGGGLSAGSIGYWSVLLVVAMFVGALAVHVRHNRRVADAARS